MCCCRLRAPLLAATCDVVAQSRLHLCLAYHAAWCGYSEEEWQAQLDKYARLDSEHKSTRSRLAEVEQELGTARDRVSKLEGDLKSAGVDIGKLSKDLESRTELSKVQASPEEREKALREYKNRALQLERSGNASALRRKLNALTHLGLAVKIHKNRMSFSRRRVVSIRAIR